MKINQWQVLGIVGACNGQGRIDVLWADRGGGAHVAGILMIIYGVYLLYPKKR